MSPRELAIILNVSQAQIARLLDTDKTIVTVRRYDLESWAREMRKAEMYLRDIAKE